MSNDERDATEAWKTLIANNVINAYVLEGGINDWLEIFGEDADPKPVAYPDQLGVRIRLSTRWPLRSLRSGRRPLRTRLRTESRDRRPGRRRRRRVRLSRRLSNPVGEAAPLRRRRSCSCRLEACRGAAERSRLLRQHLVHRTGDQAAVHFLTGSHHVADDLAGLLRVGGAGSAIALIHQRPGRSLVQLLSASTSRGSRSRRPASPPVRGLAHPDASYSSRAFPIRFTYRGDRLEIEGVIDFAVETGGRLGDRDLGPDLPNHIERPAITGFSSRSSAPRQAVLRWTCDPTPVVCTEG